MFGLSIFPFGKGSNKWVDCADAAQLDFFLVYPLIICLFIKG